MARHHPIWILSGLVFLVGSSVAIQTKERPNIIVILADDLGWNDVSFHGSDQIQTPNIDALAYNGVILNNHYVPALCTPSRAALLTGKYPTHTGTQHLVILAPEPWGLPLSHRLMPEYLRDAGYATHAIGKWHLGFFKSEYTPTYRGFDSHFGYWNGYHDYFDHSMKATLVPYKGYDMRRNMSVDWHAAGRYSTDLFTEEAVHIINTHDSNKGPLFMYLSHLAPHAGNDNEPFQAPDEDIAKFSHIEDPERRVYAAMVSKLDQSVGDVMAALRTKGMLHNSIVLFLSDNGAPTHGVHSNRGSNWPLRGMKESPWEGGIRGVAALWSPLLNNMQRVSKQMMHISDWLPTLYSAAGLDVKDLGQIDGIDMWNLLSENRPSLRTEIVHNIDEIEGYAAVRSGDWKYITGTTQNGKYDEWYGESGHEEYSLNPKYDMSSVMRSKAATAITGIITKLQIREKELKMTTAENDSDQNSGNPRKPHAKQYQGRFKLLTEKVAYSLREDSELHCSEMSFGSMIDGNGTTHYTECHPQLAPCLFNIREDPCETLNLASVRPLILHSLEETLERYKLTTVKPINVPGDPKANPIFWNATWINWQDEVKEDRKSLPISAYVVIALLIIAAAVLLSIMVKLFLTRMPEKCSLFSAFLIKESKKDTYKEKIDVQ